MPGQSAQWVSAARLLRRVGFGVTGPQVDAVAAQDWSAYLDAALAGDPEADPGARATPLPVLAAPGPAPGRTATAGLRKIYNQQLSAQMDELSRWWLARMVTVQQPIHEKLTLLWHNHFATSAKKVRMAGWMAAQNQSIRTLKLGDFRSLAYAMLTDAAMLRWLDGQTNTAKAPNENLAREFMELFALGHGNGYTEADVRDGARALTGWTIQRDGATALVQHRRDADPKTVLGVTGDLDAAGFCDAVLGHPNSAPFVATRLWRQLAADQPPSAAALDRLVTAYGPQRNLAALTRSVLTDPDFTEQPARIVSTPVEWLVGVLRSLSVPVDSPQVGKIVQTTLTQLGQRPFYPPDVGGWPHGVVWLSTASATTRLRSAAAVAGHGDVSIIEGAGVSDRVDAVGYLIGVGQWSDRSAAVLNQLTGNPPKLFAAAVNTAEYLTS